MIPYPSSWWNGYCVSDKIMDVEITVVNQAVHGETRCRLTMRRFSIETCPLLAFIRPQRTLRALR
jgi:hypothetical protein